MSDGLNARIANVKGRLAALDDDCGDGGPEAETALKHFESGAGVRLPQEYRAFMSAIRRLPALFPFYGMVPLGFAAHTGFDALAPADLAKPFPFVEEWIWEDDPDPPPPPAGWPADVPITEEMVGHGVLHLGTDGCGMVPMLIVTGARRGEVWAFTDVGIGPDTTQYDETSLRSCLFLDWVESRIEPFSADAKKDRNPPKWREPWWTYVK